ncbi:MAG: translation initiation factor IF-3 [Candidatus Dadabacteria bacterium]|nr:translation initiation factor IF-3 [Candidatus Dadabacteria bacterium]
MNRRIKAPTVRVVDDKGSQIGVLSIEEALAKAEEMRLDLVEVSPDSKPPVCRLVDYGKYKYLQKKNTKKSKPSPVKEVKLRPHIGQHDLDVKMERLRGFLQDGCKAKLRVMFRGREFVHKNTGFELISSIVEQLSGLGKIDSPARLEGRGIVAVLSPVKSAGGGASRENGAYEDEEAVKDGEAV